MKNPNTALGGPGRPAGKAGRPNRMAKKCPEKFKNLVRQSVFWLFRVLKIIKMLKDHLKTLYF